MTMPVFASKERPLRASALPGFMKCPHSYMIKEAGLVQLEVTRNMDTGSAVHKGVEAWHTQGTGKVEDALAAMHAASAQFPQADLHDAEISLKKYFADPRNAPQECEQAEVQVTLLLPAWPTDPTGEDIYIFGTADQIRKDGTLWDLKHSERRPVELYHEYSFQLACYAAALRIPIGGIINPRGYRTRGANPPESGDTKGVFLRPCWGQEHIDRLIDEIRREVSRVRQGEIAVRPGAQCEFCPGNMYYHCLGLRTS